MMPRVQMWTIEEAYKRFEEDFETGQEFKARTGLSLADDKPTNMANYNGRIVIADYAGVPEENN